MITVKLSDILNSEEALKTIVDIPMRGRLAYQFARIAREVDKESQLYTEGRNKLVEKYAERDEEGNYKPNSDGQIYIDTTNSEKVDNFTKELNELLDTEIELNVEKLNLTELEDLGITPKDFNRLMVFIEE